MTVLVGCAWNLMRIDIRAVQFKLCTVATNKVAESSNQPNACDVGLT